MRAVARQRVRPAIAGLALLVTVAGLQTTSACAGSIGIGTGGGVNPLLPPTRFGTSLLQTPALPEAGESNSSHAAYVLPALASAIVPGAGEIITGHFWRGIPFVLADVATWIGYAHYQNEGKDWRAQYETFADQHWHYSGDANGNGTIDFGETPGWQDNLPLYYDGQHGAAYDFWDTTQPYNCTCPYIPKEDDRQHYYENIGKYLFYYPGWDDWAWNGDPATSDSQNHRYEYTRMRIESNDNFDKGTDMIVVAMATRLASVVQSIFLVRGDQRAAHFDVAPVRTTGRGTGLRLRYHY
jgi:hypothetical protein